MTSQAQVASGGRLSVELRPGDAEAMAALVDDFVRDGVASRLFARDATLWGPQAQDEASQRLAWVDLPRRARSLVPEILAAREHFRALGLDRVVLCGMGGSSLAPEVLCADAGVDLVVLDSSHPDAVRRTVDEEVGRTLVVVSSKSGGTVETDSQRRAFESAFEDAGIDPASRFVVVTDPGSPLDDLATQRGWRVFHADPQVGGRYSAFSAFGLVPSGLAGVDVEALLDDAGHAVDLLRTDDVANPGLRLGALMTVAARGKVDKMAIAESGSQTGLAAWVEQLVAESTGKESTGILPMDLARPDAPGFVDGPADVALVDIGPDGRLRDAESGWAVHVDGPTGQQMMLWEVATAVAGRGLGINPFDQPDVESAKAAAREMLDCDQETWVPAFEEDGLQVFVAGDWWPVPDAPAGGLRAAVAALLDHIDPEDGYLAVHAYLDRHRDVAVAAVRDLLAARTGRPVTFGWGPRFLHSTGQYHKGGPAQGVFLQLTGAVENDLAVPDRSFTFGEFIEAQASGDAHVLGQRGRPVLRLHVGKPDAVARLLEFLA